MPDTVLIVGATGNIGIAAAHGVLKSGRNILAVVRNQTSAEKLYNALGTKNGITTVEADVSLETGVRSVVDQVKTGSLPAFQHVYSCVGGFYAMKSLTELSVSELRGGMERNFYPNLYAYLNTIGYLWEQKDVPTSWTLCTGSQGDVGTFAGPAITQGALFSMANSAALENAKTNVRFNEVYLSFRVEVDGAAEKSGSYKASKFGANYAELLSRTDIRGSRVVVTNEDEIKNLKVVKKCRVASSI